MRQNGVREPQFQVRVGTMERRLRRWVQRCSSARMPISSGGLLECPQWRDAARRAPPRRTRCTRARPAATRARNPCHCHRGGVALVAIVACVRRTRWERPKIDDTIYSSRRLWTVGATSLHPMVRSRSHFTEYPTRPDAIGSLNEVGPAHSMKDGEFMFGVVVSGARSTSAPRSGEEVEEWMRLLGRHGRGSRGGGR